jgi:hypothetical protein
MRNITRQTRINRTITVDGFVNLLPVELLIGREGG